VLFVVTLQIEYLWNNGFSTCYSATTTLLVQQYNSLSAQYGAGNEI